MLTSRLLRCAASKVDRRPFPVLSTADISAFERILGKDNVKTDEIQNFNVDWTNQMRGERGLREP